MSATTPSGRGDGETWSQRLVVVEFALGLYVAAATLLGRIPGSLRLGGAPIAYGLGLTAVLSLVVAGRWYLDRRGHPWTGPPASERSRLDRYRTGLRPHVDALAAAVLVSLCVGLVALGVWAVGDPGPAESIVAATYTLIPFGFAVAVSVCLVVVVSVRAGLYFLGTLFSRLDGEAGVAEG
jgi:hypothetical protein